MSDVARRRVAVALVLVATLTGAVTLYATWTKRQALNTERWVETSGKLLVNEKIRSALADYLTAEIYDAIQPQERLEAVLPPKFAVVAGPASAAIRGGIDRAVNRILESPRIVALWEQANRTASEALVDIVENRPVEQSGLVAAAADKAGSSNLDLSEIRKQVAAELGLDLPRLPPGTKAGVANALQSSQEGDSVLEIVAPDELESIQKIGHLIKGLSIVALIVTLALFAAAIWITPQGTRRRTLIMCGLSFMFVGIATLAVRRIGGDEVADTLAATDSVQPAVLAAWQIGTSLLQEMAVATIIYGVVAIAGGLLAGPSAAATRIRGWIAPVLRDPMSATAGTALVILLLIWWAPTPAFSSILGVVILSVLLAIGIYALRRQTLAESAAA